MPGLWSCVTAGDLPLWCEDDVFVSHLKGPREGIYSLCQEKIGKFPILSNLFKPDHNWLRWFYITLIVVQLLLIIFVESYGFRKGEKTIAIANQLQTAT